ncbi:MAG: hypothetical protein ACR2MG_14835 [Pyrinomonadaceae bacterium]
MNKDETQNLAGKIARLLQAEAQDADLYSLQSSVEKINERLTNIEAKLNKSSSDFVHPSSFVLHPSKSHPSQEKFDVAEIVADEFINNLQNEKACPYEPTGKPCDHCAMCSSRGF